MHSDARLDTSFFEPKQLFLYVLFFILFMEAFFNVIVPQVIPKLHRNIIETTSKAYQNHINRDIETKLGALMSSSRQAPTSKATPASDVRVSCHCHADIKRV